MTITDEASFGLERFESTGAGTLRVAGAWNGIGRRPLGEPTLILVGPQGSERMDALEGAPGNPRHWSATFPWGGDPATIQRAELELGGNLLIELPAPPSPVGHRRFGRTLIPVREVAPADVAVDGDLLSLHAAVVAARDDAAAALEALDSSQADLERERDAARRERSRHEGESARLREAMEVLRSLAESSLEKERAATNQLTAEVNELEATLAAERADANALREERDAALSARDEAIEKLRDDAAVLERFRAALGEAQQLSALSAEKAEAEFEQLHAALSENQRAADAARAENDRLRERVDAAEHAARAGRDEADALRAELSESAHSREELERLRAEMAGVQRTAEVAQAEADRLRRRLAAVRAVLEQQPERR